MRACGCFQGFEAFEMAIEDEKLDEFFAGTL
jgi:hypothetical protein